MRTTFSILCDVIFLVGLQGKSDIDHSWEWKGQKKTSPITENANQSLEWVEGSMGREIDG